MLITTREKQLSKRIRKFKHGEISRLAREYDIDPRTLWKRLKGRNAWSLEDALSTPVMSREECGHYGRNRQLEQNK